MKKNCECTRSELRQRRVRGMTIIEMLAASLVVTFLVAASTTLYDVGFRQQRLAWRYSNSQTDLRAALSQMTRTLRHGYAVVPVSAAGNLVGQVSNNTQVIVRVPQPAGAAAIEVMFAVSPTGDLYYQREGDAVGTTMISGVQSIAVNYFQTVAGVTSAVDLTPGTATEIQIGLTVNKDRAATSVTAYSALRNTILGP